MTDQPTAKFGEPWGKSTVSGSALTADGCYALPWNIDRAIACVNALSGIDNPEEFVKAVRELVDTGKQIDGFWNSVRLEQRFRAALVALEKEMK